jgi:hypothetical protein
VTKKLLTSICTLCLVVVGLAAPVSAKDKDDDVAPTLLSDDKIDWIAGSSAWINLSWTTQVELENVQLRVVEQPDEISIEYPNGDDHASLMIDSMLSPSEIDFTALKVTTNAAKKGSKKIEIEISWDVDGTRQSATGKLHFSNKSYKGDDFAILTEEAEVGLDPLAPDLNWVEFAYKGLAPMTTKMQITASGSLPVYHPQETFTSLHHDETLHAGELDVARVWFDPELITEGTHKVTVEITYEDSRGKAKSISHEVKLDVLAALPG